MNDNEFLQLMSGLFGLWLLGYLWDMVWNRWLSKRRPKQDDQPPDDDGFSAAA